MHPNDGRVISNFIIQALKNKDITIYGDGKQTRSFCFVDDLIGAMLLIMNTDDDFTGPMNIGNPDEFTIQEIAKKLLNLLIQVQKLFLNHYQKMIQSNENQIFLLQKKK